MKLEISFLDRSTAEADVLARELSLALLQSGADLNSVDPPLLTAATCAKTLYNICVPAPSGIRITTPGGKAVEIPPGEISYDRIKTVLEAALSNERVG
jgi:hypothetical protein